MTVVILVQNWLPCNSVLLLVECGHNACVKFTTSVSEIGIQYVRICICSFVFFVVIVITFVLLMFCSLYFLVLVSF